ncbi:lysine transporter LysE [Pseudidiomarina aestuarii]|uniref:Lysine transporter LysE n=1 Tax=Pseudidiomarina aestuarii TaxID=624146 RepID=A0A7Z6ZTK8_9GAMM|nr:LysE family translocator [Pseudidiomarina aestuarii]RUO41058.1 lysine transporter LysE [Pseudidiomarina aestuarii]
MILTEFLTIAVLHFLAVVSPGPDYAVVTRYSISEGRRVGRWVAVGIGFGILLHVAYSLLGVTLIIHRYTSVYLTLLAVGAGYLGWLGWQAIQAQAREPLPIDAAPPEGTTSPRKAFWIGFMTNGLNVKATLFFLAIFTTVIAPQTATLVKAGYGVYMAVATGVWFVTLATLITWQPFYRWLWRFSHWIDRAMGLALLAFSAHLIWTLLQILTGSESTPVVS